MKHLSFLICSLLPFFISVTGYYSAYRLIGIKTVLVPELRGTRLVEFASCTTTSITASQLALRIQEVVEDAHLDEGTIIAQHPAAGQKIKIQHPLMLTITRRPSRLKAPQVAGLYKSQALDKLESLGLRAKLYFCPTVYPKGYCFAQYPNYLQELTHKTIILYVSSGSESVCLVPDFVGRSVEQVEQFLEHFATENKPVDCQLYPKNKTTEASKKLVVREQKPVAGSFWDRDKPQVLQLSV